MDFARAAVHNVDEWQVRGAFEVPLSLPTRRQNMITRRIMGWTAQAGRWASAACDLMYPPVCVLCDAELAEPCIVHVCADCRLELGETSPCLCTRCGASIGPYTNVAKHCYWCRDQRLHFDGVVRLGAYAGLRREACLKMKSDGSEPLAAAMADLLWEQNCDALGSLYADLVVPVPLHWRRRMCRRHNPAETIAGRLARRLHRPCLHRMLKRWRATQSQSHLPPSRRYENVRGAFKVRPLNPLRGHRVVLVDDVLTTGATASEAARALKKAGADAVAVAVLCRGEGAA